MSNDNSAAALSEDYYSSSSEIVDDLVLDVDKFGLYRFRRGSQKVRHSTPSKIERQQWQSAENSFSEDCCTCTHNHQGKHKHQEHKEETKKCCSDGFILITMLSMTLVFALCELFFGFLSTSLALVADAFHMLSDAGALTVALYAINLAKRSETDFGTHSFGWQRAETIGSLVNGVYLVSVCVYTILEAIHRLAEPEHINNPFIVLIVGIVGFLINLIGFALFFSHRSLAEHGHAHSHGHSHSADESEDGVDVHSNANMHGVFLHIAGDLLGSIIVIATALATIFITYSWTVYLDPICSILFSLIILKSAVPLIRHSASILMQSVPNNISLSKIKQKMLQVKNVNDVHELHVWQMVPGYNVASVHINTKKLRKNARQTLKDVNQIFCDAGIHRTAVQLE